MVKPKTLYTCFVLPYSKEISLASSSQKLIADSLIDKSLNAMKLFLRKKRALCKHHKSHLRAKKL